MADIFANRIIKKLAANLLGKKSMSVQDCEAIREAFKDLGGSWYAFTDGDPKHVSLLSSTVSNWGKAKKPKGQPG